MSAQAGVATLPASRRVTRPLLVGGAVFALFVIVVLGGIAGSQLGGTSQPSAIAIADIPTDYLVAYERAAARYGIDWAIVAAIGKIECDHGRTELSGCNPRGTMNGAGATGPMQFLGSTWRAGTPSMTVPAPGRPTQTTRAGYAMDGDGDGIADVWNYADAIAAAARLLRANGAPSNYRAAILAYNHANWYVDDVLAKAAEYRGAFAPGASVGARAALTWAVARVGLFSYNLGPPTDRGGTVRDMQTREPSSSTCDCSMFTRWAMAQAGIDVGMTTVQQWPANGLLPDTETPAQTPFVSRGVGPKPPSGGYRPGDMIFFGHGGGADGHVALWLGNGQVVHCSSSGGGSNIRPLAGYVTPTGWVRWKLVSGG
jgi:cell wall-associated NlpC family hydrolase